MGLNITSETLPSARAKFNQMRAWIWKRAILIRFWWIKDTVFIHPAQYFKFHRKKKPDNHQSAIRPIQTVKPTMKTLHAILQIHSKTPWTFLAPNQCSFPSRVYCIKKNIKNINSSYELVMDFKCAWRTLEWTNSRNTIN